MQCEQQCTHYWGPQPRHYLGLTHQAGQRLSIRFYQVTCHMALYRVTQNKPPNHKPVFKVQFYNINVEVISSMCGQNVYKQVLINPGFILDHHVELLPIANLSYSRRF